MVAKFFKEKIIRSLGLAMAKKATLKQIAERGEYRSQPSACYLTGGCKTAASGSVMQQKIV